MDVVEKRVTKVEKFARCVEDVYHRTFSFSLRLMLGKNIGIFVAFAIPHFSQLLSPVSCFRFMVENLTT